MTEARTQIDSRADACAHTVTLDVNGQPVSITVEPRRTLLDALRHDCGMTGTKKACDMGNCGACTVVLDGAAVYSCLVLAVECEEARVETVESLGRSPWELHPLQRAFIDHDALQCGFCTPGQILSLKALFDRDASPSEEAVLDAISGNLCRCGAYPHIVSAARAVAGRGGASAGKQPATPDGQDRLEAVTKVTGRAEYTTDVELPGQLYAGIVRSRHARARIRRIDSERARRIPGVRDLLLPDDTAGVTWYEEKVPLFAEEARYIGDELAAVAAESEEALDEALAAFDVDYEPLECVADIEAATLDAAPEVHAGAAGNRAGEARCYERGDTTAALAAAEVVVEGTYTTPNAVHNALEPHACVAAWIDGMLYLWASTQGIFAVRDGIAERLGIAPERVRVLADHIGGGFGAKQIDWKPSLIAALLARQTDQPVRIALDRRAENLAVGHRNATRQHVKIGARRDGTITAIEAKVEVDAGAYTVSGESSHVVGPYQTLYRCPNVCTKQQSVYTNVGPAVAFRAPGYAEGLFGLEQAVDELARTLGIEPLTLRERNYADIDQVGNRKYSSAQSLQHCYDRLRAAANRRGAAPASGERRRRGTGVAAGIWVAGGANPPAEALVSIDEDGLATVRTGTQDIGTGTRTVLTQIAADTLDLPIDRVRIELGDTASELVAPTSAGSATLATLGPLVRAAAEDAKRRLGGVDPSSRRPATAMPVVGRAASEGDRDDLAVRTFAAVEAEVEIDLDTAELTVLRLTCAPDCGRIVNHKLATSQVIGGVTQGLGFALTEQAVLDRKRGFVLNANLEEYLVPTARDVPPIEHAAVDVPDFAVNELGIKGLGEPPIIAVAPAIANAVFDALGVRIRDLPIDRPRLARAIARGSS